VSPDGLRIAVALHDVEPATYERTALIRDWLADLGIDRATLLVAPGRDLLGRHSADLAVWLEERRRGGDAIVPDGVRYERQPRGRRLRVRASRLRADGIVRLDLHPADFDRRRRVAAVERVLVAAAGRLPVTYDELALV
jgi:predicted deacetylase